MFDLINNQDQSKQASFLLIMKMNQARKVPSNICICLIAFNLTAKVLEVLLKIMQKIMQFNVSLPSEMKAWYKHAKKKEIMKSTYGPKYLLSF